MKTDKWKVISLVLAGLFCCIALGVLGVMVSESRKPIGVELESEVVSGSAIAKIEGHIATGGAVSGGAVSGGAVVSSEAPIQTEKPVKKIKWSKGYADKVKKAMQKQSYISLGQYLSLEGNKDVANKVELLENFSIKYDTKNHISLSKFEVQYGTGLGGGIIELLNNFKDDVHYTRNNGKSWNKNKEDTSVLNINHKKIKSSYDIYTELCKDYLPDKDFVGIIENGETTFSKVSDAKKSDLTGIEYDSLGKDIIQCTYNSKWLPVSIIHSVEYTKDNVTMISQTVIKFKEISKTKISVKKVLEKGKKSKGNKGNKKKAKKK